MEVNLGWSGASLDALSPSKRGPAAHRDQTSSLLQPLQSSPPVWLTPSRVLGGDQWQSGASQSAAAAGSPLAAILSSTRPPGSFKGTSLFPAPHTSKPSSAGQGSYLGSDTSTADSSLLLKHFRKQLDAADAAKASAQLVLQDSSSLDAQFALARLTAAVLSPATPAPAAAASAVLPPAPAAAAAVIAVPPGAAPRSSNLSRWQQLRQHQKPSADEQSTSSHTQQQQWQPQQQQAQQQQQQPQQQQGEDAELTEQQIAAELEQALTTQRQAYWFAAWRQATRKRRQQQLQEQRLADACRRHRALKAWACACFGRAHWQDIQQRPQGQPVAPQSGPRPLQAAKAQVADQLHHLHLKRAALAGWAAYVAAAQQVQQERQQAVHVQATAAARAVYLVAVADRFWRLRRLHAGLTGLRQAALVAARVSCLHGQEQPPRPQQQQQQQQQEQVPCRARTLHVQPVTAAAAEAPGASGAATAACDGGAVGGDGQGGLEDKVAALLARVAAKQQQQQQGQEGQSQQQQQGRGKRRPASSPVPWLDSLRVPPDAAPARQAGGSSTQARPSPGQQQQQLQSEQQQQQQQGSRLLAEACAQMDAVLAQDDPDEVLACLAALTQQLSVEALSAEGSAAEVGEASPLQQQQQEEEEEEEASARAEGTGSTQQLQQLQEGFAQQVDEGGPQQQQQQQPAGSRGTAVEQRTRASSSRAAAAAVPARRQPSPPSSASQRPTPTSRGAALLKRDGSTSAGRTDSSSGNSSSRGPKTQALKELSMQRMQSRAGIAAAVGSSKGSRAALGSTVPSVGASQSPGDTAVGMAEVGDAAADQGTPQEQIEDGPQVQQQQQQQAERQGEEARRATALLPSTGEQPCSAAEAGAALGAVTSPGADPSEEAAVVPPQLLLPLSAEDAQRLAALQLALQRRERQQQALLSQLQRCLVQQQVLLASVHHARQLVARRGLRPWRRLIAWRAQQEDVAALWREKALLKGVLRGWRALLWARQYQRCAQEAAAQARLAAVARGVLTVRAWGAWHTWVAARRHAQQGRARAVLRAWRRRAAWVGGAAQQVAAAWARCRLRSALAAWRRVVSAQVREQLLWQLQSDQRAERVWSQHTARRTLVAWQAAARHQQQDRLDQLQQQHTWSKVRCWLLEMQAAKAGHHDPGAVLTAPGAAAAPEEQQGAAAAVGGEPHSYSRSPGLFGHGSSHYAPGPSSSLQARLALSKLTAAPPAAMSDATAAQDSTLFGGAGWRNGSAPSAPLPGGSRWQSHFPEGLQE